MLLSQPVGIPVPRLEERRHLMAERIAFERTSAAEIDLDDLPSSVTYVKLENLLESAIIVTHAEIVVSNFNADTYTAQVQFKYVNQEEDDETIYQFTSQQRAIMKQVWDWNEIDKVVWGKQEVGPVAVTIYGAQNSYGKYPMCLASIIEEIDQPAPKSAATVPQPRRDMGEDSKRQLLAGKPTTANARPVRPSVKRS